MKVVVPIWRDRISPVFDTAGTLLVVEFESSREVSRFRINMQNDSLTYRVAKLKESDADVLLCGAISRPLFDMVTAAGIKVTPFLSGNLESLLTAFIEDRLADTRYLMPGCCGWRRQKRTGRRGKQN
jgi:predicted Fe-Mo cluster-binding NifX family protein